MTAAEPSAAPPGGRDDAARPEKSRQAFRTISEVSEELDTPAHVLRFWESKFRQLTPLKRGGGRRYYRPADVALLKGIRALLYDEGLTIKGLQKVLRERGAKYVVAVGAGAAPAPRRDDAQDDAFDANDAAPVAPAGLGAVIARLEALRDRLRAA